MTRATRAGTPAALQTATDLTAVVVYSAYRGRQQQRSFVAVGSAMGAITVAALVGLFWNVNLWFVAAFFGIVTAISFGVMAMMRRQIGMRMIGFGPRGVFLPHLGAPVPWEEIAWVTVARFDNRNRGGRAAGNAASAALARSGINDGGREISVVVRDATVTGGRLGTDAHYLSPLIGEEGDAQGFSVSLSNAVDEAWFATFAEQLRAAADARGIPLLVNDR